MLILCKIPSGPLDIQTLLFMFFNSNYRDKKEQDHVLMIISFSVFIVSRGGHRAHIKTSIRPIAARASTK